MASAKTAKVGELKKDEYARLLEELQEVEKKYKLGEVDEKEYGKDDPDSIRWLFEEQLDRVAALVQKHLTRLLKEEPAWYFKFLAIESEAKEYFDRATPAYRLDMYILAQQLYRELPQKLGTVDIDPAKERVVLKNKIRVIVCGLEYLYSIGDFAKAIRYAQGLYDFVAKSGLMTKDNPAHGTLGVIYNLLARAMRQRGIDDDYQRAIDYFYKCSESYYEMARRREGNQEADVIYARTRAMVSLAFGAGFLFYNTQSDLARARALIAEARFAFLRDNGKISCELHYNYLELLYASILRAEAGEVIKDDSESPDRQLERATAEEKLNWAKRVLDQCGKALANKPKYAVHTLYNEGLVCLYLGPEYYPQAYKCVSDLLSRSQDNPRWLANGLILRSHLERRVQRFDQAFADALKAYNLAGNHLPVRIEALLASGQAQLARRQFKGARADFQKALDLNSGANLKQTAMARLLLVELAIAEQKLGQAYEQFSLAKDLMPSIKHGFILNKFRQLSEIIEDLQENFVIRANEDNLDYKHHDAELQKWLLQKALREDRSLTRAADRLNITKKTLYLWLNKHNIKV